MSEEMQNQTLNAQILIVFECAFRPCPIYTNMITELRRKAPVFMHGDASLL